MHTDRHVLRLKDLRYTDKLSLDFGNPGAGKTDLLSVLGHDLITPVYRLYFAPCALFVQNLLKVKAELKLSNYLKRLAKYDVAILDLPVLSVCTMGFTAV